MLYATYQVLWIVPRRLAKFEKKAVSAFYHVSCSSLWVSLHTLVLGVLRSINSPPPLSFFRPSIAYHPSAFLSSYVS